MICMLNLVSHLTAYFKLFLNLLIMTEASSLRKFYLAQIQKKETEINEKIQNIKRLEAQRFELNSNGIDDDI